jgi:hypothetical protein
MAYVIERMRKRGVRYTWVPQLSSVLIGEFVV